VPVPQRDPADGEGDGSDGEGTTPHEPTPVDPADGEGDGNDGEGTTPSEPTPVDPADGTAGDGTGDDGTEQEMDGSEHETDEYEHEMDRSENETDGSEHETDGDEHETDGSEHETDGSEHETDGSEHESDGSEHEIEEPVIPTASPTTPSPTTPSPTMSPTLSPTAKPTSASCMDGLLNGDESDTDCGGSCGPCGIGSACRAARDCGSKGRCEARVCAMASPTSTPTSAPTFAPTETYIEPAAASIYGSACQGNPLYVGDGRCDDILNTMLCGWDGGDCCRSTCTESLLQVCDDFDCLDPDALAAEYAVLTLPSCEDTHPEVGDGACDVDVNVGECKFDGGDCCPTTCSGEACGGGTYWCRDVAVFRNCPKLSDPNRLGDGVCDPSPFNTKDCGFDAGDCCESTCRGEKCGLGVYNCKDPTALGACGVDALEWVGDGWCDSDVSGYNTAACQFDG
jgi:hypothetical protein